jgi:endothelin-converting enzyme/putative endopeptidase
LFDWDEFFAAAKVARVPLNVEQPKFMQELNRQLADTSLTEWKTYLKWHLLHEAAPSVTQTAGSDH